MANITKKQLKKNAPPVIRVPVMKRTGYIGFVEFFNDFFRAWVTIIIIIGVSLVGFGLNSVYKGNINDVKGSVGQKQALLEQKEKELSELKEIKINYDSLDESSVDIVEGLLSESDLPELPVQFKALAESNFMVLVGINVTEEGLPLDKDVDGVQQQLQKAVITLNLKSGNYGDLKNFIAQSEEFLSLLDIQSFVFSPTVNTYDVIANTYYFVNDNEL